MTRIVTYAHRPKRPPRTQQAAPLAEPAVIATKRSRRPVWEETAAELGTRAASPERGNEAALSVVHPAANDDQKPAHAATSGENPVIVTTASRKQTKLRSEPVSVSASSAQEDRPAAAPSAIVTAASRKHRIKDGPTLPMELPLSRKPVERDGDTYKRLKTAMTRRLRGETN
jgi:hypothetical protein